MAIYKPSNCIPFSNTIDLTQKQDVSCEINTSNVNITGYKMRVLNNQNVTIFEGKNYTELNDKTLLDYNNNGLNGSELNLPLVVTDPDKSNENNIYFSGYEWSHWKPNYLDIDENNQYNGKDIYFHDQQYFKISSDTIGKGQYNIKISIKDIYEKINGQYKHISGPKPTFEESQRLGYYYRTKNKEIYSRILKTRGDSWPISYTLSEEDYNSLSGVFYYDNVSNSYVYFNPTKSQAIEDNVYYQPYTMVTKNNISETEYNDCGDIYNLVQTSNSVLSSLISKPSYNNSVLNEYYYHDSYNALNYLPDRKLSNGKYYWLNRFGIMEICNFTNNGDYNQLSKVFVKVTNFDPIGPNQKPSTKEQAYNYYYIKRYFSVVLNNPSTQAEAISEGYYYLNPYNVLSSQIKKVDWSMNYNTYINNGVLYKFEGYIQYNSSVNNINYYIDEVPFTNDLDITDDDYLNIILFLDRYILVSNVTEEFYINNIYQLYNISYSYNLVDSKPSYGESISKHYYFRNLNNYLPITNEAMQFNTYQNQYYIHNQGSYYVVDNEVTTWEEAYSKVYYYIEYKSVEDAPVYVENAIKDGIYYYKDTSVTSRNPFIKITNLINQSRYFNLIHSNNIYVISGLVPVLENTSTLDYTPNFYKPIFNFYNGYKYQPYKWQINLKQGNISSENISISDSKWYDMTITSGVVIGSTPNRLQGILSEEIYRDYYVQLCSDVYDVEGGSTNPTFIGNRTRIRTYDHSFGYLYPQEGVFSEENISQAKYFQVYKYTNDPEYVSASRKVSYATTIDIDKASYGKTIEVKFKHESTYSAYYIQVYNGKILNTDVTVNKYDNESTIATEIAPLSTSLLIKNQSDATLNGIYWFVDAIYDESNNKTTLKWQRTNNGDSYADFIETAFFIEGGTYATQNFVSDAQAGNGTIDSTPLHFYPEKPIILYPDIDNTFNDYKDFIKYYQSIKPNYSDAISGGYYYKNDNNYILIDENTRENTYNSIVTIYTLNNNIRKYFSPILKNTNTMTFIRPFVGVEDNMRFQWGEDLNNFLNINYVDSYETGRTGLWYILHDSLPYEKILIPNEQDYTITSYFKESDENPFYAYKLPYININILNATSELDYFGYPIIGNRYLLATAIYKQEQNKTWKYFQWDLINNTQDISIYQGSPIYSGDFYQKFIGLEKDNTYTLYILFEDELGFVKSTNQSVSVDVYVETGDVLPISGGLNCNLQTIDLSFARKGIIVPNPIIESTNAEGSVIYSNSNNEMQIADNIINREAAIIYENIDIDDSGVLENIPAPTTNSFTINSQHILSEYFQGEIIKLEFKKNERTYELSIDAGYDTRFDNNYEIEANPDRNKMISIFTIDNDTIPRSIWINFINVNPNGSMEEPLNYFKENKTPVFSLGKAGTQINQNCDYLYTTVSYDSNGEKIEGYYNLASSSYNELIPDSDNNTSGFYTNWLNKFKYLYNSNDQNFDNSNYMTSPLVQTHNNSADIGIWYDEEMRSNLQADGTYVLIKKSNLYNTVWKDSDDNDNLFYWHDTDASYKFYKQIDLNQTNNHSGRQILKDLSLTFNIGVGNYNIYEGTGEQEYNINTVYCYKEGVNING